MNTATRRETAKIYQFPLRPRHASTDRRGNVEALVEAMPEHICNALDNCWYHDEAVRQSTDTALS
jgi:hypothetical protein